jgi:hypothetical protein
MYEQPIFSPYKQFGMKFNMRIWISQQFNQLTNPFKFQKSTIDNECTFFKKKLCKCFHNQIVNL